MKTRWKNTLLVVGAVSIIGAVALWKKGPSDETKKELSLTIDRAGVETLQAVKQVKSATSAFLQVLQGKRCVITKPYEAYAYLHPDDEKVVCIVSRDGRSVKALIYPKAKKRLM